MTISQIIENSIYFIALINPVSKVLFLASQKPAYTSEELYVVSVKSSIVALSILIILTCVGDFLLVNLFHVEIYSLGVAGGIILFSIGLNAVKKEAFLDDFIDNTKRPSDISVVPLAAPLIAGPGAMTAAITFASINSIVITVICITIAMAVNLLCMLLSYPINRSLEKLNATGPIIRITGLIVTAVATQMIFSGCTSWLATIT